MQGTTNICNINKKPAEVILWGIGDFTKKYIHYLRESNIEIKACMDTYKHNNKFENIKLISPEEYNRRFKHYKDIPVVLTGRSRDGQDRFEEICIYAENHLEDDNATLLHPSFLADYTQFNYKDKVLITGFPGSGNILLRTIIDKLIEKIRIQNSMKESFFEKLAKEHHKKLTGYIDNFFYFNGVWLSSYHPQNINYETYHACKKKGYIEICNLKSKKYLLEKTPLTHERITNSFIDFTKRINSIFISAVRNPLDVIVSNAFKLDNAIVSMENKKGFNKSQSKFRELFGLSRINNLEWFENFSILVKEYYEELLVKQKKINMVKYETLISEPERTIKKIAGILEGDYKEEDIRKLWNQVGFKHLIPDKTHFFRPGVGKWKQYFTKQHTAILESLKYNKLLKELDYEDEIKSDRNISQCDEAIAEDIDLYLALHEHAYHILYNKSLIFTHKDLLYLKNSDLKILTNNTDFFNAANYLLSSKYFKKLTSSALTETSVDYK